MFLNGIRIKKSEIFSFDRASLKNKSQEHNKRKWEKTIAARK